jgi:hypothetical protein
MEQQEVEVIINHVLAKSKAAYKVTYDNGNYNTHFEYVPDYYEGYRKAVNQMRRISPHADVDVFPEMLFKHRAPNQSEEEAKYLRNTYRCTTHPVFVDFVSSVSNVTNEANWSWEFAEEGGDNTLQEYLFTGVPVYRSATSYLKTMIPALKAKDANGVISVKPKHIPTRMTEEGELVVDDLEYYEPMPFYYSSEQVVGYKDSVYVAIESKEKSVVEYAGKPHKVGRVFEVYDDTYIWRVEQVGKFTDHTFSYAVYFHHDSGKIPAERLKGLADVQDNGEVYWTSLFYYSTDLLDRALAKDNNVEVSINRIVFPTAIIEADECDFQNDEGRCQNGAWLVEGDISGTCKSCNGTGYKMNLSPMKNYYKKKKQGVDAGTDTTVPLQFVTPDTSGLEFVRETSQQDKIEARQMLHLRTSSTVAQPSDDTAIGGLLDQDAYFRFIATFSDQTFDTFEFIVEQMAIQRYGVDKELPSVNRPKSFSFKTTDDYLNDIKTAKEAGLPDTAVNMLIFKFFRSIHYGNSQTTKAFDLMAKADRLLTLSSDDINVKVAQQLVEPWEVVLHDSANYIVTELVAEDPSILDLDIDEQIKRVHERAKELVRDVDSSTTKVIDFLTTRKTA